MIAEIVSVGTELLMGQIVNTDAKYIAEHLAPLGISCLYQTTVGDNAGRLKESVRTALDRADIVFFTGGLGPTDDDLTKETVADALGLTCVPFPEQEAWLKKQFEKAGWKMTPNNLKQAAFPENAIILKNDHGTAPGCIMEADGKAAVLLPGPPGELVPMFDHYVLPYLEERANCHLYSKNLKITGVGESRLTYELRNLIKNQTNPTIASYAGNGEVTLRLTAKCASAEEGEQLIAPMLLTILDRFPDNIYSLDGETLPEVCSRILRESGKTVSVAEDGSGGLLSAALTGADGSELFFREGLVLPNDTAKMLCTGVSEEVLRDKTSCSRECALAMSRGIRVISGADIGLSVSGCTVQTADRPRPTGTAFVAVADASGAFAAELNLMGGPDRMRHICTLKALDLLRRKCLNRPLDIDII